MTLSCLTTTIPYTTTTPPPFVPPPAANGCLRLFFQCVCPTDSEWQLVLQECVDNALCGGGLICDGLSYYNEYVDGCVLGDPVPSYPDPRDPPCAPSCCPELRCAVQNWVCACSTPPAVWEPAAAPYCVDNSACSGSTGTDLDYRVEEVDGCVGDTPNPGSPGPPPIAVGDCCPTTTPPPPVTTTPPPYDPGCQADWAATCAAGTWTVVAVGSRCVNGCVAIPWSTTGTCTETSRTCATDDACSPGFACTVVPVAPAGPGAVPACCTTTTTTTTTPPPPTPVCMSSWGVTCEAGMWSAPSRGDAPMCVWSDDCTPVPWYQASPTAYLATDCADDPECSPGGGCAGAPPPPGWPEGPCGYDIVCEAEWVSYCIDVGTAWSEPVLSVSPMCVRDTDCDAHSYGWTGDSVEQRMINCNAGYCTVEAALCDSDPPAPAAPTTPLPCTETVCRATWLVDCIGGFWQAPTVVTHDCMAATDCVEDTFVDYGGYWLAFSCASENCVPSLSCYNDGAQPGGEPVGSCGGGPVPGSICMADWRAVCDAGVWQILPPLSTMCTDTCEASSSWGDEGGGSAVLRTCDAGSCPEAGAPCGNYAVPAPPDSGWLIPLYCA